MLVAVTPRLLYGMRWRLVLSTRAASKMAAFSLMQSSEARTSNSEQSFGSQDGLAPDDRYNEVIAILVFMLIEN